MGFRGAELPKNRDDYIKIVTVGGSTTECFYISDGKTWTDLLEKGMNKTCGNFRLWFNNAGIDGHSTFGHIILISDFMIELQPDYILFLLGLNDIERNDLSKYDRNTMKQIKTGDFKNFLISLCDYSEVLNIALNIKRHLQARKIGFNHGFVDLSKMPETVTPDSIADRIIEEHRKKYIPGYETRLETLISLCRNNGIQPVFITQSTCFGYGIDPAAGADLSRVSIRGFGASREVDGETVWKIVELYNDTTRKVANKESVTLIDLSRLMPKNSLYYYDLVHYSNKGAEVVGKILADEFCPIIESDYSDN